MSYNHNLYIGWYAEFNRSEHEVKGKEKVIRYCPQNKSHPSKNKFCPECGSEIKEEIQTEMFSYPLAKHILCETDERELRLMTGGLIGVKDVESLGDCGGVYAEFMGIPDEREIVFAPGYELFSDVSRSDGFINQISITHKPSIEWVENVKKVFQTNDVMLKFGIAMEVC